jgi:chorismate mutase
MVNQIVGLRKQIDVIDSKITLFLEKRFRITREISKQDKVRDKKREEEIICNVQKSNLNKSFVKKLFKLILRESRRIQKNENSGKIKKIS